MDAVDCSPSVDVVPVAFAADNQRVKLHPAFYLFVERTYAELVQTRGLIQTGDFQRRTAASTAATDAALQNIWEQLES